MDRVFISVSVGLCVLLCPISVSAECTLALERIASGLSRPVGLAYAHNGGNRLFVLEQHTGRIKILDLGTNTVLTTPFLGIDGLAGGNEQGLLSMAFHPDYQTNGLFYVNVTVPGGIFGGGVTEIRRYQVSATDPNLADPGSVSVIMAYDQPYSNHNGGWMDFGPDGYLYIASGDGGSANDPGNRAQDRTTLLGKMIRIDVDANDGATGLYGIPPDNPFVTGTTALDEIWAYGLRNPWRCGFDRLTGDLYIGDVGQGAREEIDFQPSESTGGENYGWRVMEGTLCADNSQFAGNPPCFETEFVEPIHEYVHPTGFAVVGGYVYRGNDIGDLQGTYFFADYSTTSIWSFRYDGQNLTDFRDRTTELDPSPFNIGSISSFGEDEKGELYILDLDDGEVYRIVRAEPAIPGDLDHNCEVDLRDFSHLSQFWHADCNMPDWCVGRDLNNSGHVDFNDVRVFADNWLEGK
jgi:glucose/arabinose dehydrogenase